MSNVQTMVSSICLVELILWIVSLGNGIDVLIEDYPNFLHGKAVGLVTNHTGITRSERKNYEVFKENPNLTLKKFFAPEHGFFGEASAGTKIAYDSTNKIGTEIISLYGKDRKPTTDMMKGLDVIIYDIQFLFLSKCSY